MDVVSLRAVGFMGLRVASPTVPAYPIIEEELPQHVVNGTAYFGATTAHHPVHDAIHARDSLRAAAAIHSNAAIEELRRRHHGLVCDDEIIEED